VALNAILDRGGSPAPRRSSTGGSTTSRRSRDPSPPTSASCWTRAGRRSSWWTRRGTPSRTRRRSRWCASSRAARRARALWASRDRVAEHRADRGAVRDERGTDRTLPRSLMETAARRWGGLRRRRHRRLRLPALPARLRRMFAMVKIMELLAAEGRTLSDILREIPPRDPAPEDPVRVGEQGVADADADHARPRDAEPVHRRREDLRGGRLGPSSTRARTRRTSTSWSESGDRRDAERSPTGTRDLFGPGERTCDGCASLRVYVMEVGPLAENAYIVEHVRPGRGLWSIGRRGRGDPFPDPGAGDHPSTILLTHGTSTRGGGADPPDRTGARSTSTRRRSGRMRTANRQGGCSA